MQFVGQDWTEPRVIGFLDNPRPCNWPCFSLIGAQYYFESKITSVMDLIFSVGATFEVKLNGGSWQAMSDRVAPTSDKLSKEITFDNGSSGGIVWVDVYRTTVTTDPGGIGFGMPPCINMQVSPSTPVPPTPRPVRNIAEVRIVVSAVAVFNAAIRDMGWSGEDQTTGYTKTPGGIGLVDYPNATSQPVLALEYTLTGTTP